MAGAWSKLYLLKGGIEAGLWWSFVVLLLSSLLNIAYLLPISARALFAPGVDARNAPAFKQEGGGPFLTVFPPVMTASLTLVLFFFAPQIADYLRPIWETAS